MTKEPIREPHSAPEAVGAHTVVVDDESGMVTITHRSGCMIRLTDAGVEIVSGGQVSIDAPTVRVDAAMAEFSGVVRCQTLITEAVVSASYTPGAGNIA